MIFFEETLSSWNMAANSEITLPMKSSDPNISESQHCNNNRGGIFSSVVSHENKEA